MNHEEPTPDTAENEPYGKPSVPWWRIGMADLVFGLFAFAILQTANQGMLDDPGLGWHLRNIDAIAEHGWWLTTDPFSLPQQATWLTNQWIGDLYLRIGEWWGGLEGIAVMTSLLLATVFRMMYCRMRQDGIIWPAALLWTYLAALGTSTSWVARPNVFTILFLFILSQLCIRYHLGQIHTWRLWVVCPLFALWANTHGGFVAGVITLAASIIIEVGQSLAAPQAQDRDSARRRTLPLIVAWIIAFCSTLLNPYGIYLYQWIFSLMGDSYFMNLNTEWHSPDFHSTFAFRYELLILLFPALLGLSKRKVDIVSLGLAVLWLHFALDGRRYIALWVVIVVPLLAKAFVDLPHLHTLLGKLKLSDELLRMFQRPATKQPIGGTILVTLAMLVWCRINENFASHRPENIPAAALQMLLTFAPDEPVYHEYNWGGYLTWHG